MGGELGPVFAGPFSIALLLCLIISWLCEFANNIKNRHFNFLQTIIN